MKSPVKSHWMRRVRHALADADMIGVLANLAWLG